MSTLEHRSMKKLMVRKKMEFTMELHKNSKRKKKKEIKAGNSREREAMRTLPHLIPLILEMHYSGLKIAHGFFLAKKKNT
jgi:hypothetical protein